MALFLMPQQTRFFRLDILPRQMAAAKIWIRYFGSNFRPTDSQFSHFHKVILIPWPAAAIALLLNTSCLQMTP